MESKQINIENVTYTMTPANAMTAWTALKNAMKLLQSVDLSSLGNNKKLGASVLTTVLANLGDPSIKELEDLKAELSRPRVDYDNNGRVKVESKKDMRKRGIPSPNMADALVMCYAPTKPKSLLDL